jgi:hypothetical protein
LDSLSWPFTTRANGMLTTKKLSGDNKALHVIACYSDLKTQDERRNGVATGNWQLATGGRQRRKAKTNN